MNRLPYSVVSCLIIFLRQFSAFAYYVVDRIVSITRNLTLAIFLRFIHFCFNIYHYYYHCCWYYYYWSFSHQRKLMVFHWRLSDSKSPQVSRTLLSILAVFNNAVVWMVSSRAPTSKSSRPFNNPLVTVPKAPLTIGIIVTFMFNSFFNSLSRSRYLFLFSHFSVSFSRQPGQQSRQFCRFSFFFFFCWLL